MCNLIKVYQRDTQDIWSRGFKTYQHTNGNRTQAIQNDESAEVNQTMNRSMIGKLQYVVHSKLDISLVVVIVAKLSVNPR